MRIESVAERFLARLDEKGRPAIAAQAHVGLAQALESDHGAGLDLLDDRCTRRPREQKEQAGVGESDRRLRKQLRRGLIFAVGVRNIDAHPARPGRPNLDVNAYRAVLQRAMQKENVPHNLRHALRDHQLAHGADQRLQFADLDGAAPCFDAVEQHLRPFGDGEDIEIGDGGRSVDAVDDDFRLMLADQLDERRLVGK